MPPPRGNPLASACYYNQPDVVKALLASGADPLAGGDDDDFPIFRCLDYSGSKPDCLKLLLATGEQFELVAQMDRDALFGGRDVPPLVFFLSKMADHDPAPVELAPPPGNRGTLETWAIIRRYTEKSWADRLACVRLLLDAGASLERFELPAEMPAVGRGRPARIHDVFEHARVIGNADLVRMLEEAASLRYAPKTHSRFPRPARYAAAELLRLGYQVGAQALVPVWAEHVLPFLVSRTSRGSVPSLPRSVLFIDALSDDQVEAMRDGEYAAQATRELQRRADGGSTAESNMKEKLRGWTRRGPPVHSPLSCLDACGDAWEAGANMLCALELSDDDPQWVKNFVERFRSRISRRREISQASRSSEGIEE